MYARAGQVVQHRTESASHLLRLGGQAEDVVHHHDGLRPRTYGSSGALRRIRKVRYALVLQCWHLPGSTLMEFPSKRDHAGNDGLLAAARRMHHFLFTTRVYAVDLDTVAVYILIVPCVTRSTPHVERSRCTAARRNGALTNEVGVDVSDLRDAALGGVVTRHRRTCGKIGTPQTRSGTRTEPIRPRQLLAFFENFPVETTHGNIVDFINTARYSVDGAICRDASSNVMQPTRDPV